MIGKSFLVRTFPELEIDASRQAFDKRTVRIFPTSLFRYTADLYTEWIV